MAAIDFLGAILVGLAFFSAFMFVALSRSKSEDHDTLVITLYSEDYTGDSLIHGLEEPKIIKKGIRHLRKFYCKAKTAPRKGRFSGKAIETEIIADDEDCYDFARGELDGHKNITIIMPRDVTKAPEKFKASPMGKLLLEQQFRVKGYASMVDFIQEENPQFYKKLKAKYLATLDKENQIRQAELLKSLKTDTETTPPTGEKKKT